MPSEYCESCHHFWLRKSGKTSWIISAVFILGRVKSLQVEVVKENFIKEVELRPYYSWRERGNVMNKGIQGIVIQLQLQQGIVAGFQGYSDQERSKRLQDHRCRAWRYLKDHRGTGSHSQSWMVLSRSFSLSSLFYE